METRLTDLVFADLKYSKGWRTVERLQLGSHYLLYGRSALEVRIGYQTFGQSLLILSFLDILRVRFSLSPCGAGRRQVYLTSTVLAAVFPSNVRIY
jgi:hypothetical protein